MIVGCYGIFLEAPTIVHPKLKGLRNGLQDDYAQAEVLSAQNGYNLREDHLLGFRGYRISARDHRHNNEENGNYYLGFRVPVFRVSMQDH